MIKQEQIRLMKGLIKHLDSGTNVDAGGIIKNPVDTYTSVDRFNLEWEKFFQDYPQIIGMSGDLPEPNSFVTINDFNAPIIATRDSQGKFRAFYNVCTHRGSVIEQEQSGVKVKFTCPFHAWTFNNEGDLIGYPRKEHFGNIDKECYKLTELPCLEKHGFLWVHPNPKGKINLDELFGDELNEEFTSWSNFDKMVRSHGDEYVTDMNWKLAIDTFGETYHFQFIHKDSLFENVYGNLQMFDTFKRNARSIICKRDMDEIRKLPEEEWDILQATLPIYYLFPNIIFIPTVEGAFFIKVYPLENSPHKCVSKISFYFHPEVIEIADKMGVWNTTKKLGSKFSIPDDQNPLQALATVFGEVIRDEDFAVAEKAYKGIRSGNIKNLTFGRNEQPLHFYHNTYREALGLPKLPLLEA